MKLAVKPSEEILSLLEEARRRGVRRLVEEYVRMGQRFHPRIYALDGQGRRVDTFSEEEVVEVTAALTAPYLEAKGYGPFFLPERVEVILEERGVRVRLHLEGETQEAFLPL